MSSPFPGMDPYLEHPVLWPGVHQRLVTHIADSLNAVLPSRYVANIGERLYVVQPERSIYPDTLVVQRPPPQVLPEPQDAAKAIAVASDPPWVLTVEPIEIREGFVEILRIPDPRRVVTILEVLSPSNKAAGSEGRELYLTKQREVLQSQVHLMEFDWLRQGEHTIAAPRSCLLEKGRWDYLVCLHRGGQRGRYEVWPIRLQQCLPRVRVPLADGDADVVLDLQPIFNRCYDDGAYVRLLDYRQEAQPPLPPDDAVWADRLLRDRGLRSDGHGPG